MRFSCSWLVWVYGPVKSLCYASTRDSIYVKRSSSAFFVWEGGNRLIYDSVNRWFLLVACQIGLRKPGDARGPRVHDLRHYFAIRTLLNWYQINAEALRHNPFGIGRMGVRCSEEGRAPPWRSPTVAEHYRTIRGLTGVPPVPGVLG